MLVWKICRFLAFTLSLQSNPRIEGWEFNWLNFRDYLGNICQRVGVLHVDKKKIYMSYIFSFLPNTVEVINWSKLYCQKNPDNISSYIPFFFFFSQKTLTSHAEVTLHSLFLWFLSQVWLKTMAKICLAGLGVNPWSKFLLFYLFQDFGMCVGYGFLCTAVIRSLVGSGDGGKTDTAYFKMTGMVFSGWVKTYSGDLCLKTMCFIARQFLCWVIHLMWGPQTVKRAV